MNKTLKIALTLILMLSGCQTKSSLHLDELNHELPYLSEEGFDINHVLSSVEYEKENIFENMIDIYEYDYEALGIHSENIIQGIVRVSPTSAQMYMVFKVASGKEDILISDLQTLLANKKLNSTSNEDIKLLENAHIEQNDDFVALIVSSDNQKVLDRIKNSKNHLFGVLTPATDEDLPTYHLTKEMVSEYAIQKPILTCSKSYIIVKPHFGKEDEVKEALESYLVDLKTHFMSIPNEEKLISNALVTEVEGYQIVIISHNNDKVLEAIQTYLEK